MRASHTLLVPILLGVVVAVPALAQSGGGALTNYPACSTTPSKVDSDQAHSLFLVGKRFFDEADYARALHNFTDAYSLDCTKTELLTVIARAYELNGNRPEAVHALETYLDRSPSIAADDRSQIQKRIDNLKAQIPAPPPPPPTATTPAAPTVSAPPTVTAPPPTASAPPPPPPPPPEERHHTALPWIVTGVGGAAAIAGGVLYLVESSAASSAKSKCVNNNVGAPSGCVLNPGVTEPISQVKSDYTNANNLIPVGSILFYAGLGVAAGGILWHFLEPTGPVDKKAAFVPEVGPGYAGASVSGHF